ncbi:ribonuclease H family protein, partial [Klebsiella pneumoniae]|uniref:ribonuclease H family protein n=1 Tax=Klebsiella pneumoniae TaxID=573 RepID=UPI003EBC48D9
MVTYYRRFCPNFSEVAAPLTDATSIKNKFKWTSKCQESFEKLKHFIISKPVLKAPNFNKEFRLQVDASDIGIGAVLLQEYNGILHPVCFASVKL